MTFLLPFVVGMASFADFLDTVWRAAASGPVENLGHDDDVTILAVLLAVGGAMEILPPLSARRGAVR